MRKREYKLLHKHIDYYTMSTKTLSTNKRFFTVRRDVNSISKNSLIFHREILSIVITINKFIVQSPMQVKDTQEICATLVQHYSALASGGSTNTVRLLLPYKH